MNVATRSLGILSAAIVIAAGASSWRPASAQAVRTDDVLPALLVEVKGLRAAMEQMASSNARAQVLIGRLQLQEGRIAGMVRRLDTVRDELAGARRQYEQLAGSVKFLSEKSPSEPNAEPEGVLDGLKSQVKSSKANVERLAAEEAQITNDVAAEQARWIDINQRLDELERSLGKK
jgi:lipopolysaccharide biosynthesis regulator YciM